MSRRSRRASLCAAVILVMAALADDGNALRGGRAGVSRGGPAAGGSLGRSRAGRDSRSYNTGGRASRGDLGTGYRRDERERIDQRQDRRDAREEERPARDEDWE